MFFTSRNTICTFLIILCLGCSKSKIDNTNSSTFTLSVIDSENNYRTCYLYHVNSLLLSDSTNFKNGEATFNDSILLPSRYLIRLDELQQGKLIILENDSISVLLNSDDIRQSMVKNSKINKELTAYQNSSAKITQKIELLFPELQRARLENNDEKLAEIDTKIKAIEIENLEFSYNYALKNPSSFISAMILNDLSKRDSVDFPKIQEIYYNLSDIVKQSEDAKLVARKLGF